MSSILVILVIVIYLSSLFFLSYWAEKNAKSKWINNPYIYTLSIAVYCTAWTYYGSVGLAASSGVMFLAVYIGPVIIIPTWIILMRKIIRISKANKISSLADLISLRYGNDRFLGALVTMVSILAIVPYISLQLKAISESFNMLTNSISHSSIFYDTTLYIAILLAFFATFFGTQKTDASEKHKGIITTIALESFLKLAFFLVIGIYITFFMFDGPSDIYSQAKQLPSFEKQTLIAGTENGFNLFLMNILTMIGIVLLPRQFHVTVIENENEKYLKTATWLFPLYLLLFNIFVIYIAWAGNITFHGSELNPDLFSLMLPLQEGSNNLALIVFLGGFSASISMVVIASLALSTMLSNNLIIPYGFLRQYMEGNPDKNTKSIKLIRRIAIFSLIISAYFFYKNYTLNSPLVSIGLISFVIIAQLAPSFFIGLFWKRGSAKGAKYSIFVGVLITIYTLVIPFSVDTQLVSSNFVTDGPWGINLLKPYQLFGLQILNPVTHAFFWSIFLNLFTYVFLSVKNIGTYRERNFAEMFVDNSKYATLDEDAYVWQGEAFVSNIKDVLVKVLGTQQTEKELSFFFTKYNINKNIQLADARMVNFSEKLLTGSIGSASARILIASVVKEEKISLYKVLRILEETKKTKASNKELKEKDKQKDEFIGTVAHELKTPLTSIRALSEILLTDQDIETPIRQKFLSSILSESERVSRLINSILDLENIERGTKKLVIEESNVKQIIKESIDAVRQLALKKEITIQYIEKRKYTVFCDKDRIEQVLINLLSNAIKFSPKQTGIITVETNLNENELEISVKDNGKGIDVEDLSSIFEKFFQSKNQTTLKPLGSGLGLAISKQIIEKHKGNIWAENISPVGARITFMIPKTPKI